MVVISYGCSSTVIKSRLLVVAGGSKFNRGQMMVAPVKNMTGFVRFTGQGQCGNGCKSDHIFN